MAAGEGGLLGGLKNLGSQSASTQSLPKGGILDALAALGTPPSAALTWPQGGLAGLASPGPGFGSLFSFPQPPQTANASTASPIERGPIGSYSSGEIAGDAAKSFGVGTGRGVIQLAGLPGDIREMLARGTQRAVDYFAPDFAPNAGGTLANALASTFPTLSGPTSSQLQNAVESFTGPFYQPTTIVGDYAQTAGEFVPGALLMPGGGLATKALRYGLFPALSSETAGQLTKGTPVEPWARVAGALLAAPASPWRDRPLARGVPEVADTLPTQVPDSIASPPPFKKGSFSIIDWSGYPDFLPKPKGPFRLLQGEEYDTARKAANRINQKIRNADPAAHADMQVHEIHPVKFGGDYVDSANKIILSPQDHYVLNAWWSRIQRELER